MSCKDVVLNYIRNHDIPFLLRGEIENGLRKCKSDDDVHELISRINYRLTVNNYIVRGYKSDFIPCRYTDEIVSDDILKVLDKKSKK